MENLHSQTQYNDMHNKPYYSHTLQTYRVLECFLTVIIATIITVTITTKMTNPPTPAATYPKLLPDDSSLPDCATQNNVIIRICIIYSIISQRHNYKSHARLRGNVNTYTISYGLLKG